MKIFALLLITVLLPALVLAETKIITSEATYIMGDGETPAFAESMALQKAKRTALEEAGTYVQSYTKTLNQDLTADEIETIAGGVVQVAVLDKTRTLVNEGLRISIKIKATITTDKMEELARRIKGKNVAEEYSKLQTEYSRLSRELESWKQRVAKAPQGPERNTALDQIREGERTFGLVQQREADLFQRLVSGGPLVENAARDKDIIDGLIKTILDRGYLVTVGEVQAVADPGRSDQLVLKVPLTIRISESVIEGVSSTATELGGTVLIDTDVHVNGKLQIREKDGSTKWIAEYGSISATLKATLVRLGKHPETAVYFQEEIRKLALLVTFLNSTSEPLHCLLWHPPYSGSKNHPWFQMRRMFPILWFSYNEKSKVTNIDNGSYDITTPWMRESMNQGYVGIVREEATFVAKHRLPAKLAKNLTGISVRTIALTAQDQQRYLASQCDIPW